MFCIANGSKCCNNLQAHTFFVIRKIKAPPKELALRLADYQESSAPDNIVSDVEVKRISATFFDDYGGLVSTDQTLSIISDRIEANSLSCERISTI